jgi:dUTP pyrophosphatase
MTNYPFLSEIHFKKTHPEALLPRRNNSNDTGYDLFAVEDVTIPSKGDGVVPTGVQVARVPENVWYLILPRSGIGFKHGIQPHLGVIDNGYRGDLGVKLYNFSNTDHKVLKGDRVAQIAYFPLISLEPQWSEEVEETDRGANGFGQSGK